MYYSDANNSSQVISNYKKLLAILLVNRTRQNKNCYRMNIMVMDIGNIVNT